MKKHYTRLVIKTVDRYLETLWLREGPKCPINVKHDLDEAIELNTGDMIVFCSCGIETFYKGVGLLQRCYEEKLGYGFGRLF